MCRRALPYSSPLFDLGFANGLPEPDKDNPSGLLYDRCGTPRYMAPEVGLSTGYGLPADVYSFGITLNEVLTQTVPYSDAMTEQVQLHTSVDVWLRE